MAMIAPANFPANFTTLYGAVNKADGALFGSFFAANGIFRSGEREPVVGPAAIAGMVEGLHKAFVSLTHEVTGYWAASADVHFVEGTMTHLRHDGSKTTVKFLNRMVTDAEGKVAEYYIYAEPVMP